MVDNQDIILYTVEDVESIFHLGRTKAYQLMHADGFPSIRINNRFYVQKDKLTAWLDRYCGKIFEF